MFVRICQCQRQKTRLIETNMFERNCETFFFHQVSFVIIAFNVKCILHVFLLLNDTLEVRLNINYAIINGLAEAYSGMSRGFEKKIAETSLNSVKIPHNFKSGERSKCSSDLQICFRYRMKNRCEFAKKC